VPPINTNDGKFTLSEKTIKDDLILKVSFQSGRKSATHLLIVIFKRTQNCMILRFSVKKMGRKRYDSELEGD